MQFGPAQKERFGTNDGAYSIVTDREHYDSQITVTDYEAELIVSHFRKENIHVGSVSSNPLLSSKRFTLFPNGEEIELNVIYPKPGKSELRLYISNKAGFKPDSNETWFVFKKDGSIWIGSMPESDWRFESSLLKVDETDDIYQSSINETSQTRLVRLKEKDVYQRKRSIALSRIERSHYTCEVSTDHRLFTSRSTRNLYLEAHHLIPIALQSNFTQSLDTIENVFSLCPFCHRAIHHAEESFARKLLETLSLKRPVLNTYGISLQDLFNLYAVEEIVK